MHWALLNGSWDEFMSSHGTLFNKAYSRASPGFPGLYALLIETCSKED